MLEYQYSLHYWLSIRIPSASVVLAVLLSDLVGLAPKWVMYPFSRDLPPAKIQP